MAEAIVNARLKDAWIASSAGTHPTDYVHPVALQVLAEIGIHHNGRSKLVDEYKDTNFDLVMTVCDTAGEKCPVWLGKGSLSHLSFPDPAKATGSEEHIRDVFRQVRDDILERVPLVLDKAYG